MAMYHRDSFYSPEVLLGDDEFRQGFVDYYKDLNFRS